MEDILDKPQMHKSAGGWSEELHQAVMNLRCNYSVKSVNMHLQMRKTDRLSWYHPYPSLRYVVFVSQWWNFLQHFIPFYLHWKIGLLRNLISSPMRDLHVGLRAGFGGITTVDSIFETLLDSSALKRLHLPSRLLRRKLEEEEGRPSRKN